METCSCREVVKKVSQNRNTVKLQNQIPEVKKKKKKLKEGNASGSTDGGHKGLDGHELNSNFVFSNTHTQKKQTSKIVLQTLHPWRHSKPNGIRPWQTYLLGPALSRDVD